MLKGDFRGREAHFHRIIHKRHGEGLLADLQKFSSEDGFRIHSLDHREYFEKYLYDTEEPNKLLAAIKTVCEYERPDQDWYCSIKSVPYLHGINAVALKERGDNVNKVFVIFERFGESERERYRGHFMILWSVVGGGKKATGDFYLFDPFGRKRPADPQQYYKIINECLDYQAPNSETCALWCVYALVKYCLNFPAAFKGIVPVEYDGSEKQLGEEWFQVANRAQFERNEYFLYSTLVKNWIIFLPRLNKQRQLVANVPAPSPTT